MTVEDPGAYRPSTPILNWPGPKRSTKPPSLKLWLALSVLCAFQLVIIGLIPPFLSVQQLYVFHGILIPGFTLLTGILTYMSMTRHVNKLAELLQAINNPMDMDRVVESLQRGRFSRFEETWKLQVESIRMFCRMLKYHHGVNPVNGEFLDESDSEIGMGASMRTFSWRHTGAQPNNNGTTAVPIAGGFDDAELAASWENHQAANFDDSATMYSCGSPSNISVGQSREVMDVAYSRVASGGTSSPNRRRSVVGASITSPLIQDDLLSIENSADPLNDNEKGWVEVLGAPVEDQRSLVFTFLKNLKPDVELSKTPIPVQVLEPRSLLEKLSDLFVHPAAFANISRASPGQDRLVAIMKWFFSAYHVKPAGAKKPFNPVLGESFECYFAKGTENEIHYFSEQVSHHPPISVLTAVHTPSKVTLTCGFYPKAKLITLNTGASIIDGRVEIRIPSSTNSTDADEVWVLNLPSGYIGGLLTGTMRVEAGGDIKIASDSSQFSASFSFERKPWLGGDYDVIKGAIHKAGTVTVRTIEGKWSEQVKLVDKKNGTPDELLFNVYTEAAMRPTVPLSSIGAKPSRLLWKDVTVAVRARDGTLAQRAKETLEEKQRQELRAREEKGEEYSPTHFRLVVAAKKPSEAQWVYTGPVPL